MTRTWTTLATVLSMALVFAAVTLAALEGREVVVLRTFDAHGQARETRTWIADADGYAWIEAANPQRPFLLQIETNPEVELRRSGSRHRCRAVVLPGPDGHQRIRRLLAAKYGWADRWIGWLTDTSGSLAVRLECRQEKDEQGDASPEHKPIPYFALAVREDFDK